MKFSTWERPPALVALAMALLLYGYLVSRFFQHADTWPNNHKHPEKQDDATMHWHDISIPLSPKDHIERSPRTLKFSWNITKGLRRPDGVLKEVYLINNQFPGPTIETRPGDELQITVHNSLPGNQSEGIAIHWHGLHLLDNSVDGVPGLTQCAIPSNASFTYRVRLSEQQTGTFWYHSHSAHQRADGLFGALIVHDPNVLVSERRTNTLDDRVLLIGDWYHRSGREIYDYYNDWKNFKIEPVGDSILLSGHGNFNCSMAVPARPVDCEPTEPGHLLLRERGTRLRLINTGTLLGFSFAIPGYSMKLVQGDGGNNIIDAQAGVGLTRLYPGERIDVIVERATMGVDNASVIITLDPEAMRFPNFALAATQQFAVTDRSIDGSNLPKDPPRSKNTLVSLSDQEGPLLGEDQMPHAVQETILLYTKVAYLGEFENRPRGRINRTIWQIPEYPLLGLEPERWPKSPSRLVSTVEQGSWVDLVINNFDDVGHPFHLHGYSFYVLQVHAPSRTGAYEAYNPFDTSKTPPGGQMNFKNPLRKDTIRIPPMGYVVLRFQAIRVGLWLLHCHVSLHEEVGMAMAIDVKNDSDPEHVSALRETVRQSCAPRTIA